MDHKESYIVAVFVIAFALFIFLVNPSYTGMVALDECDVTVLGCSDYNETECTEDLCGFSCDWNTTDCVDYIADSGNVTTYDAPDIQGMISSLQNLILDTEKAEIIQALGIDMTTTISSLSAYDLQLQDIEADTSLTDAEKANMVLDLTTQIDTFLENTPKAITITNKISGLPATPPPDITQDMIPQGIMEDLEEIYYIQDQVISRTDVIVFTMLTYADVQTLSTYIKKSINIPIVQTGYVIEILPSTVLTSQAELKFLGQYETVKNNPLILAVQMSNSAALYSYILQSDISSLIGEIQTAVIPSSLEIEPVIKVTCGDGICTELLEDNITCPEDCSKKIPWTLIIIILIIIVGGILFIHFFKTRIKNINVKGIFKRKPKEESLFNTETDKENLKNYVLHSINEGVAQEEIKAILLKKGWTKEQVELILNEIRRESQPSEQPSQSL